MNRTRSIENMRTVTASLTGLSGQNATLTVAGLGSKADITLPWSRVHERARRMATVLARYGVDPGTRVALLGDTSMGLVTAIQAIWLRGAAFTVLPLPGRGSREPYLANLAGVVEDARFTLAIVDHSDLNEDVAQLTKVLPLPTLEYEAAQAIPADPVQARPDDLAVLQYTSGSTSSPRGVPVTHAHLAANLDGIEKAIGSGAADPETSSWVSWLPLYHDMGLIGFLALPMTRGCPLVLQSPVSFALRPTTWLDRLSRHRATITGAPNFAYAVMAQLLEAGSDADLSSVRQLVTGGEPIDASMMDRLVKAGARNGLRPTAPLPAYGLAESTLAVSFSPANQGVRVDSVDPDALEREGIALPGTRRLVRVGHAVMGTRIRVVDNGGELLPERAVGHIEIAGLSVTRGYWGQPEREGWLRTGDLGYLAEGELVVCGRAKDVLFAAGRNIYPQDIEAIAAQIAGVRPGGVAAFGIPSATGTGDRLVVAVETRTPTDDLRKAVTQAVSREVGMAPAEVIPLRFGRLPKTSSGKLRRAETKRRYLANSLSEGTAR